MCRPCRRQRRSKDLEPEGIEFMVRANKSRVSRPHRVARMRLDYETAEFDDLYALSRAADYFKMLTKAGSWYTLPTGDRVQGLNGVRGYIVENDDFAETIREKLRSDK